MMTKPDPMKQAQTALDNALRKRRTAQKLMEEAEEELVQARILLDDLAKEEAANE